MCYILLKSFFDIELNNPIRGFKMPPNDPIILDLDITGSNLSNRVIDEPHTLSNNHVRAISPRKGPFFAEASLVVRSGATVLTRGVDYQVTELHQIASAKYGREISSVILIINPSIGSNITVTYQALGGDYSTVGSTEAIARLYATVMNDNRDVQWLNVKNKPQDYNPTVHRHLLEDLFGFEPVVDYLERIKSAITLGQVHVVKTIVDNLLGSFSRNQLPRVLPSQKLMQYDAFLYFLSRKKILSTVWIDVLDSIWTSGRYNTAVVDTSGYPPGTVFQWEIYNPQGVAIEAHFASGSFHSTGGVQQISIYVPSALGTIDYPVYLGLRAPDITDDYAAVSYQITIKAPDGEDDITVLPEMAKLVESANFIYFYENRKDEQLGLLYSTGNY